MRALYRFYWDCGRNGDLEGIFWSTPEDVSNLVGKRLYFGEVLGKHSEIYGDFQIEDVEILTDDQDFIDKAIEYGLVPTGFNPFGYISEEEDEE